MKRRRGGKRFEAFTDEAGHTGLNLFDPVQPWFWTGTLLTPAPFQERGEELFRRLRASVGAPVLHAKELGLPRIEQLIAVPLKGFLEEMDVHFVLTAIEKRHLAATKLADTILDSSTNKAVSRLHYGVHGLRLMLAHMLVELMEPPDHEEFWRVYALRDGTRLRPTLVRLQESLRSRPVARRQRELLSDALAWGADHAEDLLEYARSELDAPNLVALTLLMAGVHDTVSERGGKVGRFVHDQQQQFGTFMAEMYGVLKHLAMPTHATALMTQIERISTYDCKIEILPSRDVIGLQVIDVMVWLYRRSISDSMRDFPACASLVEFVDSRAYIRHHSKDQLARDAERAYADIMHMPIDDPERLAKASKMTAEIEQARKQRMRSM